MLHSSPPASNKLLLRSSISGEDQSQVKPVRDHDNDDAALVIKRSVKGMNFGNCEEKEAAAVDIKRLAKADGRTRRLLAELGVIPPLVAMLVESNHDRSRRLAVDALIELANGAFRNKKLIVEAGLLSKLPQLMHTQSLEDDRQLAFLLLSISSLAEAQFPVDTRHILPFLINILNAEQTDDEVVMTCVATLQNLSTKLENTEHIATSGAVHALLVASANKKASEGALTALGNLVLSAAGKKSIQDDPLVPKVFIGVLSWDDKPKCQELSAYLLMVIAHKSTAQRQKMCALGVVPVLIEVALLGSTLARKRALNLLEWLKDERQMRIVAHSGPQPQRSSNRGGDEGEIEERRRAVSNIVKQSLRRNMESIMIRANGADSCNGFKVWAATSSSKSLPY